MRTLLLHLSLLFIFVPFKSGAAFPVKQEIVYSVSSSQTETQKKPVHKNDNEGYIFGAISVTFGVLGFFIVPPLFGLAAILAGVFGIAYPKGAWLSGLGLALGATVFLLSLSARK